MDWSLGGYEHIAVGLLPAARAVVCQAAPEPGEQVLDIGCGTGNATFLAALRGATVTGVDPTERLLEVARDDPRSRDLDVTFLRGEAAALPVEDGVAEVVLSAFGVMFATDAHAAASEIARVASPRSRMVFSAWLPEGAMPDAMNVRRRALAAIGAFAPEPPRFPWHERDAVAGLFASHGFSVDFEQRTLTLSAPSAARFLDAEMRNHPVWVASRHALEGSGLVGDVREQALEILERANEDPSGFTVTWRYALATARR